ncbi:MAG: anaerobic sulfatase maturase [Dermatophilaceae bacterium]
MAESDGDGEGGVMVTDTLRVGPRPFHLMAKPTGAVCNLDCDYCFFLSKEALYPGSTFRMAEATLEAYLRGLLTAHSGQPEVVVAFQGGEPTLMGMPFFARVLELERELAQPGQRVTNTLQTNATLIDDEWAAFLVANSFLVGVSVDGPREMHDAYRTDKGGKPTFDRVMRGLAALKRQGADWNALTTVNAANMQDGGGVYRFLRDDLGAQFIQLIPVVERQEGDRVTHRSVTAAAYGRFMIDVFEEWVRRDVGAVFVQAFDTALAHWMGLPDMGLCVHAETCGRSLALEHNGDVYSCDHFVEPAHLVGNLADGRTLLQIVESPQQRAFGRAKREGLPHQCVRCEVRFACHGGCPKDRFLTTADGEPGLNYLCEGYRALFRHVDEPMRVMASVVARGGEAAAVMPWYGRRNAQVNGGRAGPVGVGGKEVRT